MSLRLKETPTKQEISVSEMKDGDIGVIIEWARIACLGKIVQRHKDDLIFIGESSENSLTDMFSVYNDHLRVRLLKTNEELIVS